MVVKHLKMHAQYLRLAVKTALEYRTNFLIQVASMFLNDTVWVVFWLLFFNKVGQVGNWQLEDMILLYAIITTAYGLSGVFYGNRSKIASLIVQGNIDYYITLPKNTLYHIISSKSNWYDLGDIIFGMTLAILFIPIAKFPLMILLIIMSAVILISYGIILGSLAFYMGNSEEISRTLWNSVVGLSSYPASIYKGVARFIVLTVIPAGFLAAVPVEIINSFSWKWFLIMIGFTILIALIAIIMFYHGLRKYESGNLIQIRT